MNKQTLTIFYFLGTAVILFGALQKILHKPSADLLLQVGFLSLVIFIGLSIYEIMQSKRIELPKKLLWFMGLVCMPLIVGFVYIYSGRKGIING